MGEKDLERRACAAEEQQACADRGSRPHGSQGAAAALRGDNRVTAEWQLQRFAGWHLTPAREQLHSQLSYASKLLLVDAKSGSWKFLVGEVVSNLVVEVVGARHVLGDALQIEESYYQLGEVCVLRQSARRTGLTR